MKHSKKVKKSQNFLRINVITCGSYKKIWERLEQVAVSDEQNPNISNTITYDHMWKYLDFVHPTSQLAPNFFKFLS